MVYGFKKRKQYPHTFGLSLIYTGLYKVICVEYLYLLQSILMHMKQSIKRS